MSKGGESVRLTFRYAPLDGEQHEWRVAVPRAVECLENDLSIATSRQFSCREPEDSPSGDFISKEAFERFSILPKLLQIQQSQRKSAEKAAKDRVWLPSADLTLEPFARPRVKRQKTSGTSQSSRGTSGGPSEPVGSVGADGSNNEASKDSNQSGRDLQSLGVGTSSFAASHISQYHAPAIGQHSPLDLHLAPSRTPPQPEGQATATDHKQPVKQLALDPKKKIADDKWASHDGAKAGQTGVQQLGDGPDRARGQVMDKRDSVSPQESCANGNASTEEQAALHCLSSANLSTQRGQGVQAGEQKEIQAKGPDLLQESPLAKKGGIGTSLQVAWSKGAAKAAFNASELDPALKEAEAKQQARAAKAGAQQIKRDAHKSNSPAFLMTPLKTRDSAQMGVSTQAVKVVQSPTKAGARGSPSARGRKRKAGAEPSTEGLAHGQNSSGRGRSKGLGKVGKLRRTMEKAAKHREIGKRSVTLPPEENAAGGMSEVQKGGQKEDLSVLEAAADQGDDFADLLMAELHEDAVDEHRSPVGEANLPWASSAAAAAMALEAAPAHQVPVDQHRPITEQGSAVGMDPGNFQGQDSPGVTGQDLAASLRTAKPGDALGGVASSWDDMTEEPTAHLPAKDSAPNRKQERAAAGGLQSEDGGRGGPSKPDAHGTAGPQDASQWKPWEAEKAARIRKGQKIYQEVDLLNPSALVYSANLAAAIRGLQKHPGPLMQGPCLLSGMTKQQHAWHVRNVGKKLEGQQLVNMKDLEASITEEQLVFMAAAQQLGQVSYRKELTACRPEILQYAQARHSRKRARIHQLSQYYHLLTNLNPGQAWTHKERGAKEKHPSLQHIRAFPCTARQQSFQPPKWRHLFPLDNFDARQKVICGETESSAACESSAEDFWNDARGEEVLNDSEANILLPVSAMQAFIGLVEESYGSDWEIPFVVAEGTLTGRRTVKLQKPLLNRNLSARQINTHFYKAALLEAGLSSGTRKDKGGASGKEEAAEGKNSEPVAAKAHRLDLWQLGKCKFLVQGHSLPCLSKSATPDEHRPGLKPETEAVETTQALVGKEIVVQAKLEYHSQKAVQGELITDDELAKWWLASLLHQGAAVWVGRVHAVLNRLLRAEVLTADALSEQATTKGIPQRFTAVLGHLLDHLQQLKPGYYLMTHKQGSSVISLYQSCPAPGPKTITRPLRLEGGTGPDVGGYFDLWTPHETSGCLDPGLVEYVPLSWMQPDSMVPQIPYTFRPRPNVTHRQRQRKLKPSFVTMKKGQDWDDIVDSIGFPAPASKDMYEDL